MKRFVLVSVLACLATSWAQAREWTDSSGQKRFHGEFIGWQDGLVVLLDEQGVKYGCKPERLSQADREFLRGLPATVVPTVAPILTASARTQPTGTKSGKVEELPAPAPPQAPTATVAAKTAAETPTPAEAQTLTSQVVPAAIPNLFRYVYYGHHGTYHITWKLGTAHRFHYCHDHTLVGLKYHSANAWFYYYTVDEPGLEKQTYAFARYPHHCKYDVWLMADWHHNGNYFYHRIDCADRVTPHLPHP